MTARQSLLLALLVTSAVACSPSTGSVDTGEPGGGGSHADAASDAASDVSDATADTQADAPPADGSDAADAADATDADAGDAPHEGTGPCAPDSDGDEIPDFIEGKAESRDTDHDGTPDYLDLDSDGDSIPDYVEGDTRDVGCNSPQDSDGDGTPDFEDTDSDDNGLLDRNEIYTDGTAYSASHAAPNPADTDGDRYPDYADTDNDDDALADTAELVGGASPDTDGDGLPDIDDKDSDDDTIIDGQEGVTDFDLDGTPNFRDFDSDDDGRSDACEAGLGHTLDQVPLDSDHDGKYDFVDRDSDGDGLLDIQEDKDGNCLVDPGESDPRYADTDHDGATDLVEVLLGTDPNNADDEPIKKGKFYFVMPYGAPAEPTERTLAVNTQLQKADVAFVVDTTGSMYGEITALQKGLAGSGTAADPGLFKQLHDAVPDVAIGVAAHDDYPVVPYGTPGLDVPFRLSSAKGMLSKTLGDNLTALNALLPLHNGQDDPEAAVAALWHTVTNGYLQWPGTLYPPENTPTGTYGALGFRADAQGRPSSLGVLIEVTDAAFHNGRRASAISTLHDTYTFNGVPPYPVPTIDDLVTEMSARGTRFIGLAANDGASTSFTPRGGDPYDDMAYLADRVASTVPPRAWGATNTLCKTGAAGNTIAPDGPNGTCRLVYDVYKNGSGITAVVVDGVKALLSSLVFDVRVVAVADDPSQINGFTDSVDAFVDHVEVSLSGGTDVTDPTNPNCVVLGPSQVADLYSGPAGIVGGGDTVYETVKAVSPPTKICYTVAVKTNQIAQLNAQPRVFHAVLQVKAKNVSGELDFGAPRDIIFVVPPLPQ